MTTRLSDYGQFARATILTIVSLALLISGLLAAAGRAAAISGLAVGAAVAVADVMLLVRSLRRVDVAQGQVRAGALTGLLMGRFVMISLLIGIALVARGLDKVGVIVGFLLFPLAAVVVAVISVRQGERWRMLAWGESPRSARQRADDEHHHRRVSA